VEEEAGKELAQLTNRAKAAQEDKNRIQQDLGTNSVPFSCLWLFNCEACWRTEYKQLLSDTWATILVHYVRGGPTREEQDRGESEQPGSQGQQAHYSAGGGETAQQEP
jgi:hypothetical protein